jgi:geranylgeranyl diphosphate synthase type II
VDVISEKGEEPFCADKQLFIHEKKTAALIECAMMCGAALAGADESHINLMEKVGSNVGLAFQIQDDILDETSTFEELGKPIGSDAKNNKYTYLSFVGMEQAVSDVQRLTDEAMNLLEHQEMRNAFLEELIKSLISRRS